MSKLFGSVFKRYQQIASSISLLPDDDFEHTFSHSARALEEKAMKKTADQMHAALTAYLIEHPELIEELSSSISNENNIQLKQEFDEHVKCAQEYVNKRQLKLAL